MKMEMSSFKKVHEDDKSATLQHPSGHKVVIAKKGLSGKLQKDLSSIPMHMADGGEVDDDRSVFDVMNKPEPSAGTDISPAVPQGQKYVSLGDYDVPSVDATPRGMPRNIEQDSAPTLEPPAQAAVSPEVKAPIMGADPSDMKASLNEMIQGKNQEAQAAAKIADATQKIQGSRITELQELNNRSNGYLSDYNKEYQHFQSDLQNNHINPQRYIQNMTGGQKIMSAIGMILGGIGGALTHQENPAMKFLNQSIENDVNSQKEDMNNKRTLFSANMQNFGHQLNALEMTKANLAQIVDAQLQQSAAQQGSALAMARAKQAGAQLKLQYGPALFKQMARRQALDINSAAGQAQVIGQNPAANVDPAQLVQALGIPDHAQKDVLEEIKRAQNVGVNGDKILSYFDQASKDNTVLKTGAGFLRTPGSVMALHQTLLPNFKTIDGTVRQAAMDETFKNVTPQPGDSDAKIAIKRQALQDWMHSEVSAPTAKSYGLNLQNFASTSSSHEARLNPVQQKFLSWAKQNPQDPRSQMVMQKLGLSR